MNQLLSMEEAFMGCRRRCLGWVGGALLLQATLACAVADVGKESGKLAPGGSGGSDIGEVPPPVLHAPPQPLDAEHLGTALGAPRQVLDLSLDAGGGLWVTSRDGLYVRPPGSNFFRAITAEDGLPRAELDAVGGLGPGAAIVSFLGGETPRLLRLAGDEVTVEELALDPFVARVRTIDAPAGRFALLAAGNGLSIVDEQGRVHGNRTLPSPAVEVWDVAVDPRGGAWIGDRTRLLRLQGDVVDSLGGAFGPIVDLVAEADDHVVAVEICPDGTIWASSLGSGVFQVAPDGRILGRLTKEEVLPQDHIPALACDLDGSLWIGTSWGGLARRYPDGSFDYHGAAAGLPGDSIRRLLVVPDDAGGRTLWIGTDGGIVRYTGG